MTVVVGKGGGWGSDGSEDGGEGGSDGGEESNSSRFRANGCIDGNKLLVSIAAFLNVKKFNLFFELDSFLLDSQFYFPLPLKKIQKPMTGTIQSPVKRHSV